MMKKGDIVWCDGKEYCVEKVCGTYLELAPNFFGGDHIAVPAKNVTLTAPVAHGVSREELERYMEAITCIIHSSGRRKLVWKPGQKCFEVIQSGDFGKTTVAVHKRIDTALKAYNAGL